jgi:hypothetical protein
MLRELQRVVDKDESLLADDLRRAASIVMERQFIYGDKNRDQRYYYQILEAEDYFRNLFDALNLDLVCDRTAGYVGVVPRERYLSAGLNTEETLFLLALRLLYERSAQECRIGENSQVLTDSEILLDIYETHSSRQRPGLVRMREILGKFSRQGLLEIDEKEDKVIQFRIRPSIRNVVTAGYIQALEEYVHAGEEENGTSDGEGDIDEDTD